MKSDGRSMGLEKRVASTYRSRDNPEDQLRTFVNPRIIELAFHTGPLFLAWSILHGGSPTTSNTAVNFKTQHPNDTFRRNCSYV